MPKSRKQSRIRNIAIIGNYLPRRCGIATFTTDLYTAIRGELRRDDDIMALAMDDIDEFRRYLQEIMSQESEFLLNPEELYFDCLVIDVIELVGNHLVVWLN